MFDVLPVVLPIGLRGDVEESGDAKKSGYKNIFSAQSSRPLIGGNDITLESQEHGAISELSGAQSRGLEKFHLMYGDTSKRVILNFKIF